MFLARHSRRHTLRASRLLSTASRAQSRSLRFPVIAAAAAVSGASVVLYTRNTTWTQQHVAQLDRTDDEQAEELEEFTRAEVAKHNTKDDAWIVIDNLVYDISSLLPNHPGGDGILWSFAGKDATAQFRAMKHSDHAKAMRAGLLVGKVTDDARPPVLAAVGHQGDAAPGDEKRRVMIIGAGICGTSAAYFLSQEDKAKQDLDIQVVDRDPLVGGTALKSSAIMFLGPLIEKKNKDSGDAAGSDAKTSTAISKPAPKMRLTQYLGVFAYDYFNMMQREWSDIQFSNQQLMGIIETDDQMDMARTIYRNSKLTGTEIVTDKARIQEIEPAVASDRIKGIVHHARGATMDPYLVAQAFATRAEANGVRLNLGKEVCGIEKKPHTNDGEDGYLVHFQSTAEDGTVVKETEETDVLVICTGWRAKQFASYLGHNVPVKAMHGQMMAIDAPDVRLKNMVYGLEGVTYWRNNKVAHQTTRESEHPHARLTNHLYGVQLKNGIIKFGGDRVIGDMDGKVLEDGIQTNYEMVVRLFPALKGQAIVGSWSGTMPFTPDQKIICGELTNSLFVLTGSGFTRGLASGMLLAESMKRRLLNIQLDKQHDEFLKECDPLRFASGGE